LQGQRANPKYGVGATLRVPVLVGEAGALATPPVGFGFQIQLRLHPWRVGRTHLGLGVFAGHLRVPTVIQVGSLDDPGAAPVPRQQLISHTDFAGGFSFHVPAGAVILAFDLGAGAVVSTFVRPTDVRSELDERVDGVDPLVRGGVLAFIPVRRDHGPFVAVAALHPFSPDEVTTVSAAVVRPFSTVLDAGVGYMAFF
jgi:hypothetical protein